jgi:hypothetical protein
LQLRRSVHASDAFVVVRDAFAAQQHEHARETVASVLRRKRFEARPQRPIIADAWLPLHELAVDAKPAADAPPAGRDAHSYGLYGCAATRRP